ncbi:MAG TPA: transporter substrate-binding domain-containing protein [Bacteroides reticulotermitis]|nr:transporter substrate-binding domain-containing protein [Bacteroides reticulotermitis]
MAARLKSNVSKYLLLAAIALVVFLSLRYCSGKTKPSGHPRDYAAIAKEGIIRVATEYNSLSFYVDGDSISGFHYDLIQAFAHDKSLKALITPEMSFTTRLEGLSTGKYDLIAYGILVTSELKDSLLFTSPIVLNRQVLVQRKKTSEQDSMYIRNQLDLAGRKLYVTKGSPAIMRIRNLSNEIGDTIYVEEIDRYGSEQLIAMVAHGDIPNVVCDESIALAVADSLPQIDITTAISFTQFYSWAVSKQSPALLDSLNTWLDTFQKTKEYQTIYRKYYDKK